MTSEEIAQIKRRIEFAKNQKRGPIITFLIEDITTLLDDHARLTDLVQSLSERCHKQSELLTQHAEEGS